MEILARQRVDNNESQSRLGFATTGGGNWEVWDRFITYDGQPLFHIGSVCGTCSFFFTRQTNPLDKSIVADELVSRLNDGIESIDVDIAKNYSVLFPNDSYEVLLLEIHPRMVFPDDSNDYFVSDLWQTWDVYNDGKSVTNTEYYRGMDKRVKDGDRIFEFFIPLYPSVQLDEERIRFYEEKITQGQKPTALALSVLDVKSPSFYPTIDGKESKPDCMTHWCVANYLVDGHHKIHAAHRQKKSITLLAYVSRGASWKMVDELIEHNNE